MAGRHDEYFVAKTIQKWDLSRQADSLAVENWSWLRINTAFLDTGEDLVELAKVVKAVLIHSPYVI